MDLSEIWHLHYIKSCWIYRRYDIISYNNERLWFIFYFIAIKSRSPMLIPGVSKTRGDCSNCSVLSTTGCPVVPKRMALKQRIYREHNKLTIISQIYAITYELNIWHGVQLHYICTCIQLYIYVYNRSDRYIIRIYIEADYMMRAEIHTTQIW